MLGSTNKSFCHTLQILAIGGRGFELIVKKGKFVMAANIQENKEFDRFEIRMYNKSQ